MKGLLFSPTWRGVRRLVPQEPFGAQEEGRKTTVQAGGPRTAWTLTINTLLPLAPSKELQGHLNSKINMKSKETE